MKTNIRGKLNAMEVEQTIALSKKSCLPSSVRVIAAVLKNDYGKRFTVSATDKEYITVTRIS